MKSLYAVQAASDGHVKIGRAANVEERIASLQTAHSEPLKLLAVASGFGCLESQIHSLISPFRVRGEWFDINADICIDLLGAISEGTIGYDILEFTSAPARLQAEIRKRICAVEIIEYALRGELPILISDARRIAELPGIRRTFWNENDYRLRISTLRGERDEVENQAIALTAEARARFADKRFPCVSFEGLVASVSDRYNQFVFDAKSLISDVASINRDRPRGFSPIELNLDSSFFERLQKGI